MTTVSAKQSEPTTVIGTMTGPCASCRCRRGRWSRAAWGQATHGLWRGAGRWAGAGPHTGIGGHTPASRVTNLSEQHT
ncbi:hypothetical protein DVA86_30840 [Streptomyces armeniacus]|uniref:Uncharacterized protein n=1 Tax=Streptomyces armeniacus TaxID=83291 RepID=A0A345XXG3_9ACTN|nr:hypothetical protein DVA86_30840 [Streptomyces armeniacus]